MTSLAEDILIKPVFNLSTRHFPSPWSRADCEERTFPTSLAQPNARLGAEVYLEGVDDIPPTNHVYTVDSTTDAGQPGGTV